MEKQLTTKTLTERPKRVPLASRSRLTIKNKDPNYQYRIVNANLESDPDRILNLQEAGYELVPKSAIGDIGDKRVDNPSALGSAGLISVGQGTKAVVMRQRREDYEEDQAAKQAEIAQVENDAHKRADYGSLDISVKRTPT